VHHIENVDQRSYPRNDLHGDPSTQCRGARAQRNQDQAAHLFFASERSRITVEP
jgi:hypothetical protein